MGGTASQRKALLRGLVGSLLLHERIETTIAKAKEAKRLAERMVTLAVRGDLHSKRLALSFLPNREAVSRLFAEIGPRFSGRPGGYLRIVQTRRRVNDQAQMAVLEFIDFEERRETAPKKKAKEEKTASAEKK